MEGASETSFKEPTEYGGDEETTIITETGDSRITEDMKMEAQHSMHMSPSTEIYFKDLCSKNELLRSDTSIFPSYTHLTFPYRVVCRHMYHKAAVRHRKQFLKEITEQELLQSRALDGVRLHRVFCNPILSYPEPEEIITLTPKERRKLEWILIREF